MSFNVASLRSSSFFYVLFILLILFSPLFPLVACLECSASVGSPEVVCPRWSAPGGLPQVVCFGLSPRVGKIYAVLALFPGLSTSLACSCSKRSSTSLITNVHTVVPVRHMEAYGGKLYVPESVNGGKHSTGL